jgi:hypothetical protein
MAMYINDQDKEYHIGRYLLLDEMKIETIQADGDELLLCMRILRIEKMNNRIHTFVGDNVREIIANWNNYQNLYS